MPSPECFWTFANLLETRRHVRVLFEPRGVGAASPRRATPRPYQRGHNGRRGLRDRWVGADTGGGLRGSGCCGGKPEAVAGVDTPAVVPRGDNRFVIHGGGYEVARRIGGVGGLRLRARRGVGNFEHAAGVDGFVERDLSDRHVVGGDLVRRWWGRKSRMPADPRARVSRRAGCTSGRSVAQRGRSHP